MAVLPPSAVPAVVEGAPILAAKRRQEVKQVVQAAAEGFHGVSAGSNWPLEARPALPFTYCWAFYKPTEFAVWLSPHPCRRGFCLAARDDLPKRKHDEAFGGCGAAFGAPVCGVE